MAPDDRDYRPAGRRARAAWTLTGVLGGRSPAVVDLTATNALASSEGSADGLADDVGHERCDPTECELAQAAADGRPIREEAHAEAEQE